MIYSRNIACFLLFILSQIPVISSDSPQAPVLVLQPDFGDHSSQTLTTKAWDALSAKKYDLVKAYADKCIELYGADAQLMQKTLTEKAPADKAHDYWALNDVGTCLFIKAQAFEDQDMNKEAIIAYKKLVSAYRFAQTWDANGWFWSPADAAKQRIQVLEFSVL